MKKAAWILAIVFGLAFLGATLRNADLVLQIRKALATGVLLAESSAEAARYQAIVVVPDTEDSFFRGLLEGIAESAPACEAAVQVFRYSSSSPAEAERYWEIALRTKVDGLIMYIPRDDRIADRIREASRNGVVFVPVGTDAPAGSPPGFIGSGSLLQGLEGGRLICAGLGSAARIGVLLPASGAGDPREEPLYLGIAASIQTFPGAAILVAARSRPGILSGEEAAAIMLREHPAVNAILCSSSLDTAGAAQVVVDMNRAGSVFIIGADETPEIRRYIEKGVVAASIVRDSKRIGQEAIRRFASIKAGWALPVSVEAGFTVLAQKGTAR
jgi:ribose transport system substrate-binding protein